MKRTDGLFSLCGLNCGLCPMNIRGECGGCFTDSPCYPNCPIAPCSVRHGGVEYCFQCSEYPCRRYDGIDRHDSLVSHRNQKKDLLKAKEIGIESYLKEQRVKRSLLERLLSEYDNGRQDVFYCLAVNMLDSDTLTDAVKKTESETNSMGRTEKSERMEYNLRRIAKEKGVPLELRR